MMNIKTISLQVILMLGFMGSAFAQSVDSNLVVYLNKSTAINGDTINFDATLKNFSNGEQVATLHLWVEEIKTGKQWHYRYPFLNGSISAQLIVSDLIKDGEFAFNFSVQKSFFSISGQVKNIEKIKTKILNYVIISKDKQAMSDAVALDNNLAFSINRILFQDSAFIIFSNPKQKKNDLKIDIVTALDSTFIPKNITTRYITIGNLIDTTIINKRKINDYSFSENNSLYKTIMPAVIVNSKSKKLIEDFEKENVTGLFSGSEDILLDGLSSDDIANASDLYTYLSSKVGGLRIESNNETGNRFLTWRKKPTEIFINEIKLDSDESLDINPSDIAMIKIFRPGSPISMGSNEGGAIAIYLKTGGYKKSTDRSYSFYILGYTGLMALWK